MNPLFRSSSALSALSAVIVLCSGCSGRARVETILEKADQAYHAGKYDEAEIEYKNVLQRSGANGVAIARLGLLYHEQGRESRAIPFLLRAQELRPDDLDVRLKLGISYLAIGNLKLAHEAAAFVLAHRPEDEDAPLLLVDSSAPDQGEATRNLLQSLPSRAAVRVALGNLELRQGRRSEAEKLFKEAAESDPKSPVPYTALGFSKWAQNDLAAADAAFKQAAALSPDRSPRRLHYVQFKTQTGDIAGAKQLLAELQQRTPDFLPATVWQAEIALAEKKYDEADANLTRALARDGENPEALILKGRLLLAKNEPEKAVIELERLMTSFPNSPRVAYHLGLAYAAAGDGTKAAAKFAQVLTIIPQMEDAALALAEINLRRGDVAAAVTTLKRLAQERPELVRTKTLLAEAYRQQGNLAEAAAILKQLREALPANPQLAVANGILSVQQNQPAEARKLFEQALAAAPDDYRALEQLTELDVREKRFAPARERLEAAASRAPDRAGPQILLGRVLLAQGDTDGGERALMNAIQLDPESPIPHFMLARMYIRSNQHERAIARLTELLAKNPKNTAAQLLIAIILHERKDYAGARDAYEKVLVQQPKSTLALNNLAYLYTEQFDETDKALDLAKRARALLPQDPSTADTLGWAFVKKKQYASALPLLQESLAKLPNEAEVHYHLGTAHYWLGNDELARASLQRAVELNATFPAVAEARQRLALLALDPANGGAAAREALEKRVAQQPDDVIAEVRLGDVWRQTGATDKALAHYLAAIKANPKHIRALMSAAKLYAAKNDVPKALELAKDARAVAPDDPGIAHTLGRLAFLGGDHRWAANLLQEVSKQRPTDPELLFDWADATYSIGRVADAEDAMRQALNTGNAFSRSSEAKLFLDLVSLSTSPAPTAAGSAKIEQTLKADPSNVPALMAMAVTGPQKNDPAATAQIYEKVLGRFPEFSPAQRELTFLYAAESGRNPKAAAIATKARQAFPKDAAVARAGGIIAFRDGEFAKAVNLLQESVSSKPDDGEALYYLGMAQGKLNKRSESKQTLQRALDAGLKETLATEAKKTLASAD